MKPEVQDNLQDTVQAQTQRRAVRAIAQLGSLDTPLEWAGSQARLLTFERQKRSAATTVALSASQPARQLAQWQVNFYPFEPLEALLLAYDPRDPAPQHAALWLEQVGAQAQGLPPNWLAQLRPLYDPAQVLGRLRHIWDTLPQSAWAARREQQLGSVRQQLATPDTFALGALPALLLSRQLAREYLLPALVGPGAMPLTGWRLPHHWHAQFALSAPRSVALLDRLYGLGSTLGAEGEAARVLRSMRGLGMLGLERQARGAVQAGYFDGAVRLVRDEAAALHSADIQRWAQLSPARRERLGVLLGLEVSPLGAAALATVHELVDTVRREARPATASE